ncbi:hypothetical protein [Clostridium sardiniense]|uniref:hypothetical protein n=1 Tax=Clostridium sardiniense TaxID=29369 RepID=UPI003D333DE0
MINIDSFIRTTINTLKKINVNDSIDVRPFKKDRKVVIIKNEHSFDVIEDGFFQCEYRDLKLDKLKKLLKTLKKREFPRSNKLWFNIIPSD